MPAKRIELRPVRQADVGRGQRNYHIYAGTHLVGCIYQHATKAEGEQWFFGINTVLTDARIGRSLQGYADSFDDAKVKLRAAFEAWLVWALSIEPSDLKHPVLARQLAAISFHYTGWMTGCPAL
jgi:hypothetical protein